VDHPALASATSPAITDINAAGGLNLSGFVLGEQEGFSSDTGKTALPRLLMETSVTETLEPTTFSIPTFRFAGTRRPRPAPTTRRRGRCSRTAFTGFLVRRQNIVNSVSDAAVAGQFVDNAPIIGSVGTPKVTGTGADAHLRLRRGLRHHRDPDVQRRLRLT
jgi:hypothetical protein